MSRSDEKRALTYPTYSGDEAVLLTRYEDVRRMLSDPRFGPVLAAEDAARIADDGTAGTWPCRA